MSENQAWILENNRLMREIEAKNIVLDNIDRIYKELAEAHRKVVAEVDRMKKEAEEHAKILLKVEHERDCRDFRIQDLEAEISKLKHIIDSKDDEIEVLRRDCDNWEQNSHEAGELYCGIEDECQQKDAEILRLKAEIYDLRKGAWN